MMAGDRAKRLDPARALPFYRRARETLPEDDPERVRALVEAAEAAEDLALFGESRRDFDHAIEEARTRSDPLALGEALARRARSVQVHGATAGRCSRRRSRFSRRRSPDPSSPGRTRRWPGTGTSRGRTGRRSHGRIRALALADELGMEGEAVLALQYRGAARAQAGDSGGLGGPARGAPAGLELGRGTETSIAYNNLAYQLWFWEGPEAALRVWDEMASFCRVRGFQTMALFAQAGALESMFDVGDWDQVLRTAQEMREWDLEHGPTRVSVTALTYEGWVHLRRGGVDAAATTLEVLMPLARGIGYAEYLAPSLVLGAECHLATGDREGALEHIREFAELTEEQEDYRAMFLAVVVRILVEAGALEDAEALVGEAGPPSSSRHRLGLATARAIVAEARGASRRPSPGTGRRPPAGACIGSAWSAHGPRSAPPACSWRSDATATRSRCSTARSGCSVRWGPPRCSRRRRRCAPEPA